MLPPYTRLLYINNYVLHRYKKKCMIKAYEKAVKYIPGVKELQRKIIFIID